MKGYCDFCEDFVAAENIPYAICDNKECGESDTCIVSAYYHAWLDTVETQEIEQ